MKIHENFHQLPDRCDRHGRVANHASKLSRNDYWCADDAGLLDGLLGVAGTIINSDYG